MTDEQIDIFGLRIHELLITRPKSFAPRPRANIKEAIQFQKAFLRFFPVNSFVLNVLNT